MSFHEDDRSDKKQICINFDGNASKCNARYFKKELRMGVLNLSDEIEWNNNENIWMNSKYRNTPCKQCFCILFVQQVVGD